MPERGRAFGEGRGVESVEKAVVAGGTAGDELVGTLVAVKTGPPTVAVVGKIQRKRVGPAAVGAVSLQVSVPRAAQRRADGPATGFPAFHRRRRLEDR